MTLQVFFVGGESGAWRVVRQTAPIGEALPNVPMLRVIEDAGARPSGRWTLRAVTSNARYVTREETSALRAVQAGLGRPEATRAVMIPMTKSPDWWALAQDERRAIFEERSRHVAGTLKYLPAIARRLHHGRDLGEPFDFVTWFEHAPEHEAAFDELVGMLRETEEWRYVIREVELRLVRAE
jgi:chlorite dismutase